MNMPSVNVILSHALYQLKCCAKKLFPHARPRFVQATAAAALATYVRPSHQGVAQPNPKDSLRVALSMVLYVASTTQKQIGHIFRVSPQQSWKFMHGFCSNLAKQKNMTINDNNKTHIIHINHHQSIKKH